MITTEHLSIIGKYIREGMTEKESCVLAGIDPNELIELKEKNEDVRLYIEKRTIEFKYVHLKEIQSTKSEKNSQWLLEKVRPEEFGTSRTRSQEQPTINIFNAILKDIQNDNSNGIITLTRNSREDNKSNESNQEKPKVANLLN